MNVYHNNGEFEIEDSNGNVAEFNRREMYSLAMEIIEALRDYE